MQLFFAPRSVGLIGVTRKTGPGAYNNLEMMTRYGYPGKIYLVHPQVPEILGHKTYPRVTDLPEAPDLAVISLGRDRVLPVFKECAQRGIRRVVVISQGFADADPRGQELQDQLVQSAREYGVRVLGPNTLGIVNPFASFSTAFVDIPREPSPPPLTMVVQSGVFQAGFTSFIGQMGKSIDIGNAGDLDLVDVLIFLEGDPQTRIIVLHLEGLKRGREFLEVAARLARQKPIIILKTGRSAAGAQAAMSHTGSMTGEDALFDVALAQTGLIRVRNLVELRAACQAFLHLPPLDGPRVGVVTASGACGIMAADACEDYGLELAPFPEKIRGDLENPRISWHRLHNPVDIWPLGMVTGSFTEVFIRAVTGLIQDDRVDAVVGVAPTIASPLHTDLDLVAAVRKLRASNTLHKPLALFFYGDDAARQSRALAVEPNVVCFDGLDEAFMGLSFLWRYQKFQQQKRSWADFLAPSGKPTPRPMSLPPGEALLGETALKLLQHYQIPVAPGRVVQEEQDAVAAAMDLGYPVVLKIISPQWLHKSDWGGVRLHIATEAELRKSFQEFRDLFSQRTPSGNLHGFLIQKQLKGTELIFGIKRDPHFGPVLLAGLGGIYTEIFRDVARALAPLSEAQAAALLKSLQIYPILQGYRGQPGVYLPGLIQILTSLSQLALDYPEIQELDLNPVLAEPQACWCVDCRIVLGREDLGGGPGACGP